MIELWNPDELIKREECPVCAAPLGRTVAKRVDGLAVRDCPYCAALYVDPAPNFAALARCYGPDYFIAKTNETRRSSAPYQHYSFIGPNKSYQISDAYIAAGKVQGHDEILSNFDLRGKKILEIGCATGALLQSLKKYSPARLVGIDIAAEQIEYGRRNYKDVELHCGTLENLDLEDEFDLILMLDILEHVYAPSTFFRSVCGSLRPHGSIFIRTPNGKAFDAAGSHWSYLFWGLEHLTYTRPTTLNWLSARNGLALRKTWSKGCPGETPLRYWSERRIVRLVRHPLTSLSNRFCRASTRYFENNGQGLDIFALILRPPHQGHPYSVQV
ncbi:MAG: class I SAM-dependent methyltransferase [Terriglobia bacterium]